MSSNRLSAKPYRHILFLMLAFGSALRLHAAAPGDGTSPGGSVRRTGIPDGGHTGSRRAKPASGSRRECDRHPHVAEAGTAPRPARPSAAHVLCQRGVYGRHLDALPGRKLFRLAERRLRHQCRVQLDVAPGLRRRNRLLGRIHLGRTQRDPAYEPHPLHRTGVRRPQRAGRRWLFRESAGIGYGRYIRSYGDTSGSRGGVGIHESASVEFMLGRHIGLGAGISGQWLIVDSPDVDDGAELNLLGGIFRFQFGGGLRVYF